MRQKRTPKIDKLRELLPITAMSRDHRTAIFRRSRSRSLNTPEVALAHEALTHWLNGGDSCIDIDDAYRNTPESTKRICNLLVLIKDVIAKFEKVAPQWYPYHYGKVSEPTNIEKKGVITQFGEISRALTDYATVPYLAFQPSSKLWGVGHWPVGLTDYPHNGMMHLLQRTYRPYGEVIAAHGILELARCKALDRIRVCDCKCWYFAKRKDGVACSDTCRKRIHDRKPETVEKRKKKAEENREYTSGKIHMKREK